MSIELIALKPLTRPATVEKGCRFFATSERQARVLKAAKVAADAPTRKFDASQDSAPDPLSLPRRRGRYNRSDMRATDD